MSSSDIKLPRFAGVAPQRSSAHERQRCLVLPSALGGQFGLGLTER
jgi:hypothetical protein